MTTKNMSNRREFLRKASMGSLGLLLLSRNAGAIAANDKVVVAHIGLGSMGNSHLRWFAGLPDVRIAALCDLDEQRLGRAMDSLKEIHPDTRAKAYTDFRRILEREDIDAITCATPDHWHAPIANLAFQAGKDVYGEKPLSYTPVEGRAMLGNLNRYERVFQLGTQIHAGENYHRVVELVRSGRLGKIHTARIWKTGGPPALGFPANRTPPESLNWDMWLGPAPYAEYTPARCHGTFRYFFDYSGGVFGDFWCHIADIVFWALEPGRLLSIDARGEVPHNSIADTPLWIDIDYEFEDLKIHWTTTPPQVPGAADRQIGACFEGTKGSLLCDYSSCEVTLDGEKLADIPDVPKTLPRSPGHQRNFIDSVKSRTQPESNLEYVRRMTLPMHLGLISFRLGRKLVWDDTAERFVGDNAANYLLSRPYRAPWIFS
ncbi:MAG: Gfo/Idh/MocA family oxidoreductase [Candidatus Glassbacteria bacterium]|nr:Gfo/Idh/MocA family oxidoreductase [Candidatus Glassbacteria bacterium]